jgi:hypothetical protein
MRLKTEIIKDIIDTMSGQPKESLPSKKYVEYQNKANIIYSLLEQEGIIEGSTFCQCLEPLYSNVSKGSPVYMCQTCKHKIKPLSNKGCYSV